MESKKIKKESKWDFKLLKNPLPYILSSYTVESNLYMKTKQLKFDVHRAHTYCFDQCGAYILYFLCCLYLSYAYFHLTSVKKDKKFFYLLIHIIVSHYIVGLRYIIYLNQPPINT